MRLLVLFPSTLRGGTEEYALTIASAAAKEGWDVHAAFPQTKGTATLIQDFAAKGVCYHPIEIAETEYYSLKAIREHLPRFLRTVALLLKLKPDIVQVNLPAPYLCLSGILACGFLKIPTVVVFHLIPFRFSFASDRLKAYAWAQARNQKWITISEYNRKLLSELFQIPQDEVTRIYNGTKVTSASTNRDSEDITTLRCRVRQELGLVEPSRLILTVGRLSSQKGYGDLVPAVSLIVEEFPDVKFLWVGEGEQQEHLVEKVREYGVEDKVFFLGYRSDVPRLLRAADLFVFPTHFEGLPFALIEAMNHSLPIVASDASSIPEVITNGRHGLLFPTGDICRLVEALGWALKHPDLMQEMARNAQLRTHEFSEERMVKETLDLLQDLGCTFR